MNSLFNCRTADTELAADYFGLIGDSSCTAGCYIPSHMPELIDVYAAVGGLDFPDLPNLLPIGPLPGAIQVIRGDSSLPFRLNSLGPVIATRYTQLGGLRGREIDFEKVKTWRARRNVPDSKRVLLMQESADDELESLFPATLAPDFFRALHGVENVLLLGAGYSVYDAGKTCEWLQLLNLKRSIHFAWMANAAGLPCIPCIGWHRHRPRDLERLAEWLNRQGEKVTHLAVNAQTGGASLWWHLATGMSYLERATGRCYHWVVCGGADALQEIFKSIPAERVTQMSSAVATYTIQHRLIGHKGTSDLAANELLRRNMERENWRLEMAELMARSAYRDSVRSSPG